MKLKLLLFCTLSCVIFSCNNKKTNSPEPDPGNNPIQTTSGKDAEIYALKQITLDNMGPAVEIHGAIFYASPVTTTSVNSVNAGIVNINGVILKKDSTNSPGPAYVDSTYSLSGNTYIISNSGSAQFPSGSLQYGQNFPTLIDTNLVPSSVTLSAGINVTFNVANTDSVSFILEDGSGPQVYKKVAVINNHATLAMNPLELSAFSSLNVGYLTIDMVKFYTAMIGTKNYAVTLEKRYFKLNIQFN